MSHISTLKFVWREAQRRQQLITGDFIINNCLLLEHCERASKQTYDYVSPIGWTSPEYQAAFIDRLLLNIPALLPSGRRELLVCPECADLGCGCISSVVSLEGNCFVWHEIGFENDYDPESLVIFPMGKIVFQKDDYYRKLSTVLSGIR